jgi:hypothetical protein
VLPRASSSGIGRLGLTLDGLVEVGEVAEIIVSITAQPAALDLGLGRSRLSSMRRGVPGRPAGTRQPGRRRLMRL